MESICNIVFTVMITVFIITTMKIGFVAACTILAILMYTGVATLLLTKALFIGVRKVQRHFAHEQLLEKIIHLDK